MPGTCYISGEIVQEGEPCSCRDDIETCIEAECSDYSEPSEDCAPEDYMDNPHEEQHKIEAWLQLKEDR